MQATNSQILWALILTALMHVVFATFPAFDIWISSQFWNAESGFHVNNVPLALELRDAINKFFAAFVIFALAAFISGALKRPFFDIPTRIWGVIFLMFLIGPGLLANGLLKAFWGRARPVQITEFGGDLLFTPPFEIAGQCAANCSFVSGEASNSAAFVISFLLLARYIKPVLLRHILGTGAVAIALYISIMRIILGRHFLSDVLFAWVFVALIALVLIRYFLSDRSDKSEPAQKAEQTSS